MPAARPDFEQGLERLRGAVAEVAERIEAARGRAGGDPVSLLPVTKGHPIERVRQAAALGFKEFGENYLQECQGKAALEPEFNWHLLGHLQRNKAARAALLFGVVETIDTLSLAQQVSLAHRGREPLPVLCEVDFTEIPGRSGFKPGDLLQVAPEVATLPGISLGGLMTVADPASPQRCFSECRELREQLVAQLGRPLPVLSMGMSDDFELAIAEGSTQVRLGSVLFGPRPPRPG
ncbi:MAG: YggS family pyridoxal phosphate-dependent enzyme [Candidatus Dormibacteria bacterium]